MSTLQPFLEMYSMGAPLGLLEYFVLASHLLTKYQPHHTRSSRMSGHAHRQPQGHTVLRFLSLNSFVGFSYGLGSHSPEDQFISTQTAIAPVAAGPRTRMSNAVFRLPLTTWERVAMSWFAVVRNVRPRTRRAIRR